MLHLFVMSLEGGVEEADDHAALVPVRDRGFKKMNILPTRTM